MPLPVRALICSLLVTVTPYAVAQAQKKLPAAVYQELAEMTKTCRGVGGRPAKPHPGLLTVADLTGDGVADFVIDYGMYVCDGAASVFSGNMGSQMSVHAGTPDGQATLAFSGLPQGVEIDTSAKPARVWLTLAGQLCGQKVTRQMARADEKGCQRPLAWNERTRKFDYAPLSQVRPLK